MKVPSRGALAADPLIGAGNVLGRLLELGADPDGPGLTFDTAVERYPAEHPLTLGQLDERVSARAAGCTRGASEPRDPVAIWSATAADQILSFLAANRLGAIPALMNGNLPAATVAAYIGSLRARAAFADADRLAQLRGEDLGGVALADVAELGEADPAGAPVPYRHHRDDPIVHHPHLGHHRDAQGGAAHPRQPVRRHPAPAEHAAGPGHPADPQRAAGPAHRHRADGQPGTGQPGRTSWRCPPSRASRVLAAIEGWRPEGVFGFSVTWAELARLDLSGYDLDCVRLWFNTGDCTHEPHVRHLVAVGSHEEMTRQGVARLAGSSFIDGLGSSEMGHSMFHITHRLETDSYDRCIGQPYRFAEAAVLDDDGEPVADGEVGHLGIASPSLSPGYWNDSVTTLPVPPQRLLPDRRPGAPGRRRPVLPPGPGRRLGHRPGRHPVLHRPVRGAYPGRLPAGARLHRGDPAGRRGGGHRRAAGRGPDRGPGRRSHPGPARRAGARRLGSGHRGDGAPGRHHLGRRGAPGAPPARCARPCCERRRSRSGEHERRPARRGDHRHGHAHPGRHAASARCSTRCAPAAPAWAGHRPGTRSPDSIEVAGMLPVPTRRHRDRLRPGAQDPGPDHRAGPADRPGGPGRCRPGGRARCRGPTGSRGRSAGSVAWPPWSRRCSSARCAAGWRSARTC